MNHLREPESPVATVSEMLKTSKENATKLHGYRRELRELGTQSATPENAEAVIAALNTYRQKVESGDTQHLNDMRETLFVTLDAYQGSSRRQELAKITTVLHEQSLNQMLIKGALDILAQKHMGNPRTFGLAHPWRYPWGDAWAMRFLKHSLRYYRKLQNDVVLLASPKVPDYFACKTRTTLFPYGSWLMSRPDRRYLVECYMHENSDRKLMQSVAIAARQEQEVISHALLDACERYVLRHSLEFLPTRWVFGG